MTLPDVITGVGHVQAHNDERHAINTLQTQVSDFASISNANSFAGIQQFVGPVGFGTGVGSTRQPFESLQTLNATDPGTIDKIGHELQTYFKGNYGLSTGTDAIFGWGMNLFTATGTAAGDGAGGRLTSLLAELDIRAASGSIVSAIAVQAQARFFGPAAGATVTTMASLWVSAPDRTSGGATGGVANNVYGLLVEPVLAATLGSTLAYSMWVQGGISRFGGEVQVNNTITNQGGSNLDLFVGTGLDSDGGHLQLVKAGGIKAIIPPGSSFQISDGTNINFTISAAGVPKWNAAGNFQTTVGAAGGASALPATPTKYVKILDQAGTTYVVPVYAAT